MDELQEKSFELPETVEALVFYGYQDVHMKMIEDHLPVRLIARGHTVKIIGTEETITIVTGIFNDMIGALRKKKSLSRKDVETAIQIARPAEMPKTNSTETVTFSSDIALPTKSGYIQPRSEGQKQLIDSLKKNDIIFAVGPAGTGKTYLAVAMAVAYLKENRVRKIVLARPAVEAGESLGFLPGDFKEKIDPYLKPLYDALEDMLPRDLLRKYLDQQIIEIIPLAYMRGRTLNHAFVILDEAQNSTFMQMKMFLTRLGYNAKAVITGDITQIDLPSQKASGLVSSIRVLSGIKGIAFVRLSKSDVVRHYLVKEIIDAYDKFDQDASENGDEDKS